MRRREFLQLAKVFNPDKHFIASWKMSEKLDGQRSFWDGGTTRGLLASNVPWANTTKDARYINRHRIATGLWSRYGKVISAPDWWLDQMPLQFCDGELYLDRGKFETLRSTVSKIIPTNSEWSKITYQCFYHPQLSEIFETGEIKNANMHKVIDLDSCKSFIPKCSSEHGSIFKELEQEILPPIQQEALDRLKVKFEEVIQMGGEGLILRHPTMKWEPRRSEAILKVKPAYDSEAEVIGYTWGRETDKGSRLIGKMGALICIWRGKKFELSGFTDAERSMTGDTSEAVEQAGKEVTIAYNSKFPVGSKVTFIYRELTDEGIPKEARYWRKFSDFSF